MAANTKIEWATGTWNPFVGCKKISAGCKYCYMHRDQARWGKDGSEVRRTSKTTWRQLSRYKEPQRIFVCSMSDFFIQEIDDWREDAWQAMRDNPQHTYMILTKRPERIMDHLPDDWGEEGWPNVWLGISAENQKMMDSRVSLFLDVPARVRFLSIEPLIDRASLFNTYNHYELEFLFTRFENRAEIDWIIIGGESGNDQGKHRYRPCKESWIRNLLIEADQMNIPVFVKQMGTQLAKDLGLKDRHGRDISEWPKDLQVRQFPEL
ncbi:MAG: DUF5131 family protein [Bacteroidota bacterium]